MYLYVNNLTYSVTHLICSQTFIQNCPGEPFNKAMQEDGKCKGWKDDQQLKANCWSHE